MGGRRKKALRRSTQLWMMQKSPGLYEKNRSSGPVISTSTSKNSVGPSSCAKPRRKNVSFAWMFGQFRFLTWGFGSSATHSTSGRTPSGSFVAQTNRNGRASHFATPA